MLFGFSEIIFLPVTELPSKDCWSHLVPFEKEQQSRYLSVSCNHVTFLLYFEYQKYSKGDVGSLRAGRGKG